MKTVKILQQKRNVVHTLNHIHNSQPTAATEKCFLYGAPRKMINIVESDHNYNESTHTLTLDTLSYIKYSYLTVRTACFS